MTAAGLPLRWEAVRFGYAAGADAVRDVSLGIPAGDKVALVGPNGAGKTTLTRMLVGLVRPQRGRVVVGDVDVAGRRPDQMAGLVGYAFQHADQQLFARTVRDDVAFGPRQLELGDAQVDEILEELGLEGVARRHPYDLPAPLRKLAALAGVLAMRTPVLVLDEPTAAFDRELRSRTVAAIQRRHAAGATVLAISHDGAFIADLSLRRLEMRDGTLVG